MVAAGGAGSAHRNIMRVSFTLPAFHVVGGDGAPAVALRPVISGSAFAGFVPNSAQGCDTVLMSFGVVVIGSANLDLVLQVNRHPDAGETILATGSQRHAGGKGLNQAVAAARGGAHTAFVGAVGRDEAGQALLETMRDAGIDTSAVRLVDRPTGMAMVLVQPSGENAIIVEPGANALAELTPAGEALIRESAVLVAQLEVPLTVIERAVRLARTSSTTVVLNAAPVVPVDDALLSEVDILVVNEHEAVTFGGAPDAVDAATALSNRVGETIVTLGASGAAHVTRKGEVRLVPGIPVTAVDTTGAGDTFVGVLAASISLGMSMTEALNRAVVAGAVAVEGHGAVPSIPTRQVVDERLRAAQR